MCEHGYSVDFFTVPTATFGVLFVFFVLAHDRRRIVHFNVTEDATAQQIVDAFPFANAPRYRVRDGDGIYGDWVERRIPSLAGRGAGHPNPSPFRTHRAQFGQ